MDRNGTNAWAGQCWLWIHELDAEHRSRADAERSGRCVLSFRRRREPNPVRSVAWFGRRVEVGWTGSLQRVLGQARASSALSHVEIRTSLVLGRAAV